MLSLKDGADRNLEKVESKVEIKDLKKYQVSDTDPRAMQWIHFTGNIKKGRNVSLCFI